MTQPKRFRIAFSFAGAKRPYVEQMADMLAAHFRGRAQVLYDRFHQAELARLDLILQLGDLYFRDSDLVVAVICRDYSGREWCGLEWTAIRSLARDRPTDVLLMRFDYAEASATYMGAGYVDLDDKTPAEAVELILERLALNEQREPGRDALAQPEPANEPPDADWPETPPPLDWRMADHTDARQAFAKLIVSKPDFRVMLVRGPSNTGKSTLIKQFKRNARKIAGLRLGVLEFDGMIGIDSAVREFARELGVAPPDSDLSVSEKLTEIVHRLSSKVQPTLLLFDSFQTIDESGKRWFLKQLADQIHLLPWLRVVLMGQEVPGKRGELWEDLCSWPIELRPPSDEDWFAAYREYNDPRINLELVRIVMAGHGNDPKGIALFLNTLISHGPH